MKPSWFRAVLVVMVMTVSGVGGAKADDAALEALKQQMQQLQQQMQDLQQKITELETVRTTAPPTVVQAPAPAEAGPAPPQTAQPWSPSQPITLVRSGANYLNISFDTLVFFGWSTEKDVAEVLELGDHDPQQRGFSLRNAEIALDGAVDPYFKGFGNIVFKLDQNNETEVELEEAYLLTTSLPWNLQVKAGQFFAAFGRQNATHPHTWAFVDEPLVMQRLLGSEGLRNVGAQVSWLAPTPFYTELMLGVFNGQGETAFSFRDPDNTYGRTPVDRELQGPEDMLYVPRITSSFDLTDTQTVVLGASAAFGPNDSGTNTRTQIYGADLYWKWRPVNAEQGFPFLAWQTEAMYRSYKAGADPTTGFSTETLKDYGFYSQILYGFHPGWVAGLRGEFVGANFENLDPLERGERTRISPDLTWYPTEFTKLRLQYNYDHGQAFGTEHSVWTQVEFLLGAHGAHKF
jgi:hypothetical protein